MEIERVRNCLRLTVLSLTELGRVSREDGSRRGRMEVRDCRCLRFSNCVGR